MSKFRDFWISAMPFLLALATAALLGFGFTLLAFRFARVIGVHVLAFWGFIIGMPLATALTGLHGNQRMLAGEDLSGEPLASALVANVHLYVAYGLGLLVVAAFAGDRELFRRLRETFARQRLEPVWAVLFAAVFGLQVLVSVRYGRLVSGVLGEEMPYLVSSVAFLATSLAFALFCYLSILSTRHRRLLALLLPYCAFLLVSTGRREFLYALMAMLILRGVSVGFRFSWRFIGIAATAVALFVLITPFFLQMRAQANALRNLGVPPVEALIQGASAGFDAWRRGGQSLADVRENVGRRGNSGVFLLSIASLDFPFQHGDLLTTQLHWAIPSAIMEKPRYQVEARIQALAGMEVGLDDAPSAVLVFYADFGWFGVFLAGLAQAAFLYVAARLLATGRQFGLFRIGLLGLFFTMSIALEAEIIRQFVEIRNVAILGAVTLFLAFIKPPRSAGSRPRGPTAPMRARPLPARPTGWTPRPPTAQERT